MSAARALMLPLLLLLAACHSEPFTYSSQVGPLAPSSDQLLTRSPLQDYWPTWTEDSTGLMYAFVYGDFQRTHRCMGILPAAGGQRYWEWCDNAVSKDSLTSFPAFAMGHDGRLLYAEAAVAANASLAEPQVELWLADSAQPHRRRSLLKMPLSVGDSAVNWLGDLEWTGPSTFLALAERRDVGGQCRCSLVDSLFYGEWVVTGTVGAGATTLVPVAGTAGATAYSRAENGASIIFTRRDNVDLLRVPIAGGSATVAATATNRIDVQLTGVSCRGSTCIVAVSPISLTVAANGQFPSVHGAAQLHRVSLATGDSAQVASRTGGVFASPLIAPSGDVAVQFGQHFGHLQTISSNVVDLRLYAGLAKEQ